MAKKSKEKPNTHKMSKHEKNTTQANSDVLGSYTGMGENGEAPVQDADDL